MTNVERDGNGVATGDRVLITDKGKRRYGSKGVVISNDGDSRLTSRTYCIRYDDGNESEFFRRRFKILVGGLCGYCKWGCAVEDKEECPFYEEED